MQESFEHMQFLAQQGEQVKNLLALMALCSLRLYAAMQIMPMTTDTALQGVTRNALALSLGAYVAWGQPMALFQGMELSALFLAMAKETIIGLCIGYAVSSVFWVAEGVGIFIDNQAGFNSVQQTNPLSGEQSTPLGNLLSQLTIAGFYILGGMTSLFSLLFESYKWWPVTSQTPMLREGLLTFLDLRTGDYLQTLAKVAMPAVFVFVLIDLGIGMMTKAGDKLEPNNLGQPIKGSVALFLLALLVALFFDQARPQIALLDMRQMMTAWLQQLRPGN